MGDQDMEVTDAPLDSQQNVVDEERGARKPGGWITLPFLVVSVFGVATGLNSTLSNNIQVYMLEKYHVRSINTVQIYNVINGSGNFAPIAGAIVADSFFGPYAVAAICAVVSVLCFICFTVASGVKSLQPPSCTLGVDVCEPSTGGQLGFFYFAVVLLIVAVAGSRFNTVTLGANQYKKASDQEKLINWYTIAYQIAGIAGFTLIVYLESSISWTAGFAVCAALGAIGAAFLIAGSRYYIKVPPSSSAFTSILRVIVVAVKKWKINPIQENLKFFYGMEEGADNPTSDDLPSKSFRFLNRAAVVSPGDVHPDGSLAKPWHLCSVQEVEDFKVLIRILPLWTASLAAGMSLDVQFGLIILQSLTMDRSLGKHFTMPAGSMLTVNLLGVIATILFVDIVAVPLWLKISRRMLTPIQRIGFAEFFYFLSMVVAALVERKRLRVVHEYHAESQPYFPLPMKATWLFLPLAILGIAEAFHFTGQLSFYYQEFPKSLKSTATGMFGLVYGVSSYIAVGALHLIRKNTDWLHDNLNISRVDKVYWSMAVAVAINFVYFLVCAKLYKYQNIGKEKEGDESTVVPSA